MRPLIRVHESDSDSLLDDFALCLHHQAGHVTWHTNESAFSSTQLPWLQRALPTCTLVMPTCLNSRSHITSHRTSHSRSTQLAASTTHCGPQWPCQTPAQMMTRAAFQHRVGHGSRTCVGSTTLLSPPKPTVRATNACITHSPLASNTNRLSKLSTDHTVCIQVEQQLGRARMALHGAMVSHR